MKRIQMEPELKMKWTEALTNGEYLQAEGILYEGKVENKPKMCCLGVLENICGNSLEIFQQNLEYETLAMPDDLRGARKSPKDVLKQPWKDEACNGDTEPYEGTLEEYFAHMNDYGKSFEEIATYIDQNL